jgi:hypothetical protein
MTIVADTRACACGALATERCVDCRTVFCPRHGSTDGDFIVATLQTDLLGLLAHWNGAVSTSDGSPRCLNCLAARAHRIYSEGAARAAAALPPLPPDRFVQCCIIAAGGFALSDPRVDRSIDTFARSVHRLFTANRIRCNGSSAGSSRGLVRRRGRARESWMLRCQGGDIHVFKDGTWFVDAPVQLTQVTDEAFADVAVLAGYFEP